jgi:hypothetical protein
VIERLWAETVGRARQLDPGSTEPVAGPGWPPPESFPVREILATIINEEWWHRQFAERDLAALAAAGGQP